MTGCHACMSVRLQAGELSSAKSRSGQGWLLVLARHSAHVAHNVYVMQVHQADGRKTEPLPCVSQVQAAEPEAVDAAIAGLRYGCVAVNTPAILPFSLTKGTWGGFPGSTIQVHASAGLRSLW